MYRLNADNKLDLQDLRPVEGFSYSMRSRGFGTSASGVGDINGDGIPDVFVGNPSADTRSSVSSFVFFGTGTQAPFPGALHGSNGFRIPNVDNGDSLGVSVAPAGDVNGDGIDDFIIGAETARGIPNTDNHTLSGEAYVVFGTTEGFAADFDLSALDGANGFIVYPDPTPRTAPTDQNPDPRSNGSGDRLGAAVSGAGDINNDGFDDVIIGAWSTENSNGLANPAGAAYVVFGSDQGFDPSLTVTDLDGTNGFAIRNLTLSQSSGRLGFSVADAGDVNNDGIADIIIGEQQANDGVLRGGAAHVIFGTEAGFPALVDVSTLDGTNGFSLLGLQSGTGDAFDAGDFVGNAVDGVGDFNGDGIDDVIVGAMGAKPEGSLQGAAYVVFGSSDAFPATFTIDDIDGTNGIELFGGQGGRDRIGFAVAGVGDVTGDGLDDALISVVPFNSGVFNSGGIDRDPVFLVFGTSEAKPDGIELRALDGEDGFWIVADGLDNLGFDVAPTGDLDGDGVGDLIITEPAQIGSGVTPTVHVVFAKVNLEIGAITDEDPAPNQISETATAGTPVGITALAIDPNETDTVTYIDNDGRFITDPQTGVVTLGPLGVGAFDAETESSVELTITAGSSDLSSTSRTFVIAITDANEAGVSQVIDIDATPNFVPEFPTGIDTPIGITLSASDPDASDTVSFSVSPGNFAVLPDGTVVYRSQRFVDPDTGEVSQIDAEAGFETDPVTGLSRRVFDAEVEITATATSTDGSTSSTVFTVPLGDVNEFAVQAFNGNADGAEITIDENSTGFVLFADPDTSFGASDEDRDDGVTFSATAPFTVIPDPAFDENIDPFFALGRLAVAEDGFVDAETTERYEVIVTATSDDGSSESIALFVNVRDDLFEFPVSQLVDLDPADATLSEVPDPDGDGTEVTFGGIKLFAEDPDVSDDVDYALLVGNDRIELEVLPDGTPILPSIFDQRLPPLNADDPVPIRDFTFRAISSLGTSSSDLTIPVTLINADDVPLQFVEALGETAVLDTLGPGDELPFELVFFDDAYATLTVELSDARFDVVQRPPENTGLYEFDLFVAEGASFDADLETSVELTITANSDFDTQTVMETVAVSVFDGGTPSFSIVDADPAANTILEIPPSFGPFSTGLTVVSTIPNGPLDVEVSDERFRVAQNEPRTSSSIVISDPAGFDHETEPSIDVTVTAFSATGFARETFTIAVQDVNEPAVVTDIDPADNVLPDTATPGTPVGITISAIDPETGPVPTILLQDNRFEAVLVDGEAIVRTAVGAVFDAANEPEITLDVSAVVPGDPVVRERFTIAVEEGPPPVGPLGDIDPTANIITEVAAEGTAVGIRLNAVDPEPQDTVAYEIESVGEDRFRVAEDGTVEVAAGAVFSAADEPFIDLAVVARSSDGSESRETFRIFVIDTMADAITFIDPMDISVPLVVEIMENDDSEPQISVLAIDADADDTVSYALQDDPGGAYTIARDADGRGVITFAPLDAEAGDLSNTLIATSTDGSFAELDLQITVLDVEEFAPEIRAVDVTGPNLLPENQPGFVLNNFSLSVSDGDATDTLRTVTVDDDRFEVMQSGPILDRVFSGQLRLKPGMALDAEEALAFSVLVTATYSDDSSASLSRFIEVVDEDEFPFVPLSDIDPATPNLFFEDAPSGFYTGLTVRAEDEDATANVTGYSLSDPRFRVVGEEIVRSSFGSFDTDTSLTVDLVVIPVVNGVVAPEDSETFPIIVLDGNDPITRFDDLDASPERLIENAPTDSTVGLRLFAEDADGSPVGFEIVGDPRFIVVSEGLTGVVRTTEAGVFNHVGESEIELTVRARSQDGSTLDRQFTIDVLPPENPVGPLVDTDDGANRLADRSGIGATVGIVLDAIDPDPGDVVSFEVLGGDFMIGSDGRSIVAARADLSDLVPAGRESALVEVDVEATSSDLSTSAATFAVEIVALQELRFEFDQGRLDEGATADGKITIELPLGAPLTVALTASPFDELVVPATVTIPAGERDVLFDATAVVDEIFDGNQTVTVAAQAPGTTGAETTIQVDDTTPDPLSFSSVIVLETPEPEPVDLLLTETATIMIGEQAEMVAITGLTRDDRLELVGLGQAARFTAVDRGSVILEIDRRDDLAPDLTVTLSGGAFDDPEQPFGVESFMLDYDDEADLSIIQLRDGVLSEIVQARLGTEGDDVFVVDDPLAPWRLDGLGGSDTVRLPGGLGATEITAIAGGFRLLLGSGQMIETAGIETFLFEDNTLAVDSSAEAVALARLYSVSLDRDYDLAGMTFWREALDAGLTLVEVALSFLESAEYGALGGDTLDDAAFLTRTYDSGFGRSPDDAGFAYWSNLLQSGAIGREDVIAGFATSTEMALRDCETAESGVLLLA